MVLYLIHFLIFFTMYLLPPLPHIAFLSCLFGCFHSGRDNEWLGGVVCGGDSQGGAPKMSPIGIYFHKSNTGTGKLVQTDVEMIEVCPIGINCPMGGGKCRGGLRRWWGRVEPSVPRSTPNTSCALDTPPSASIANTTNETDTMRLLTNRVWLLFLHFQGRTPVLVAR